MNSQPTNFGLVEPFDTDDLVGVSPDMCFALGVEWEMFRQKLRNAQPFTDLVIDKNAARLVAMAERQKRFVEHHLHCDGWVMISVGNHV